MGEPLLKFLHQNKLSLTMQETNHAGHGPCSRTSEAHQDGSSVRPLEQAPPRPRVRSSSNGLRPVRGATPSSNGLRPVRGATLPSSGPAPLEGSSPSSGPRFARGSAPPSAGARHAHGRPARVRRPCTWAFNALTPQDGVIMRPGLTPRCRRTNSPGRSPSPLLWDGLCGTAGVSPVTPCVRYCTANAPDPRKGAGRTLDSTFP
jgi:hypothetical protein